MQHRIALTCLLAAVIVFSCLGCGTPVQPADADEPALSDLSIEVDALRTLHYFKVTPEQLKRLQKLAPETAQSSRPRKAKGSDEYRQALTDLHEALVDASDDDRIDNLDEQLDQLKETEKPELEDDVEITDAARRKVPEVLRQLTAGQVAAYVAQIADEVGDPLEKLTEKLGKVRNLKAREWKEKRDEIAEEVGDLVAGLDKEKAGKVSDQVMALLSWVRGLSEDEFAKQRPDLDAAARKIVGDLDPVQVLRHQVERALAELLSNPRLEAAVKARLK